MAPERGYARETLARFAELGFSHVAFANGLVTNGYDRMRAMHAACDEHGLALLLEIDLTDLAVEHPLVVEHSECFSFTADSNSSYVDPRLPNLLERRAIPALQQHPEPFVAWWTTRLSELAAAGANGFYLSEPQKLAPDLWRMVFDRVRNARAAPLLFIADTSQLSREAIFELERAGFDFTLSSLPWWNGRASWLVEQHEITSTTAPAIALVEAPRREPPTSCEVRRARLATAAVTGAGIMMPFGYESGHCEGERSDLFPCVKAMNSLVQTQSGAGKLRC